MPSLQKIRVIWGGELGLPGVSTFYSASLDKETPVVAVKNLFSDLAPNHPAGITWTVEESGVMIDEATGQPNGTWAANEAGGDVPATGPAEFAAPVGYVITWHTETYVGGRELRGRTFMVPAVRAMFGSDGRIGGDSLASIRAAVNTYVAEAFGDIYSPTSHGSASVQSATVPNLPAVLRSRRD